MAKAAKKETALTPEEKLEMALVPNIEQLYPVLDNWCWVKQGTVSLFINGRAYKQVELLEDPTATPVLRVGNLFTNGTWYFSDLSLEEDKYIDDGELIYAWSASFGPFIWHGRRVIYHYHIWKIMLSDALLKEYYYYWLMHDTERLKKQGHGTGMIHVTKEIMESSPMPLPPLAEQQRIVDRIESLFAKLDEAKEKAQAVVDGYEERRAAILHKAYIGEITKEWRKNNKTNLPYEYVTIESVCRSLKYGTAKKSEPEGSVVVIRMGNLQQGEIDWTNLAYSNDEEDNRKYQLYPGDVLFNRTNSAELVGKTAIYRGEYPAIFAGYLIKLDYDHSRITGDYLNYILNSPEAKAYCNKVKSDGVNQSNINAKKIGAFTFRLPAIEEQIEAVRIIKSCVEKEKMAKEAAEQVVEYIDAMKKFILVRAFRGELGTNDPNDESAIELLKRVLK